MSERQYKDAAGTPCSLWWLVKNEPEWAVNQIRHREKIESERDALKARVTTLQSILDQRWEMMRELEEVCETKDVAKAVEYVKGLKARVKMLEDAGDKIWKMSGYMEPPKYWKKAKESKP